jgi:CBS domain-containing protein
MVASRTEVYSVQRDATVHEAAGYLREKHIRAVGVIDASGRLMGVVSQSDMAEKVVAENQCPAWIHVEDIMTRALITVHDSDSPDDCLRLLNEHGIHHLPVLDRAGTFRGMVSVTDLLELLVSEERSRADLLESFVNSR